MLAQSHTPYLILLACTIFDVGTVTHTLFDVGTVTHTLYFVSMYYI